MALCAGGSLRADWTLLSNFESEPLVTLNLFTDSGSRSDPNSGDPWYIDDIYMASGKVIAHPLSSLITGQPQPQVVYAGDTAAFSVSVEEAEGPAFQWQSSFDGGETFSDVADGLLFGATLSGAHTETLTVSSASLMLDGLVFRVRVTVGDAVEFSGSATLSVVAPSLPVFLSSPASRSVEEQSSAEFSVSAGGLPEPSVRWQVSSDGGATFVDLAAGAPYSGVNTTTLTVDPVALAMNGHRFRAVAENSEGTAESAFALLTVTPLPSPPEFTVQPQDQSVAKGAEAVFSAEASGHPGPDFQWQISLNEGGSYSNITESSFGGNLFRDTQTANLRILAASSFVDGALFRVHAANSEGEVFSAGARLTTYIMLTLDEWLAAAGVPADRRGPSDRHGPLRITNLEAYAMGLSPFEATAAELPRMDHVAEIPGVLRFHYRVNTRAEGVSVSMESSSDLATWTAAIPEENNLLWEDEGVQGREALFEAADTLFVRLRVEAAPEPMVLVEGGTLSTSNELDGTEVDSFYIGRYQVTWGEWQEVRAWGAGNGYEWNSRTGRGCADDYPVHYVNWYGALQWCNAKSEMAGLTPVYTVDDEVYRSGEIFASDGSVVVVEQDLSANGYRLLLEAEWEFAARGGNQTNGYTYAGSNDLDAVGWYRDNSGGAACDLSSGRGTWPVGQKAANELGLYDMSGNVSEWCWDQHETSDARYIRGGSWFYMAHSCTVSYRFYVSPRFRDDRFGGFRLARTPSP